MGIERFAMADPDKVAFFPEDYSKYFTPPEKVIDFPGQEDSPPDPEAEQV